MELCNTQTHFTEKHKTVFADRKRSNLLKDNEQRLIYYLLKKIPAWISPNILTGVGMIGSLIIFTSFLLAKYVAGYFLLLAVFGLLINWIGDSLDGRLAYFRNIPRKWYGFALDMIMDWLSIILTGLGYYYYEIPEARILGFLFVVFYGWSMIIALIRYKITDVYRIDSGWFGPTELRIVIAFILILEWLIPQSITYSAVLTALTLLIINVADTIKLLNFGNERDRRDRNK